MSIRDRSQYMKSGQKSTYSGMKEMSQDLNKDEKVKVTPTRSTLGFV